LGRKKKIGNYEKKLGSKEKNWDVRKIGK
jgi:hypothetical protein